MLQIGSPQNINVPDMGNTQFDRQTSTMIPNQVGSQQSPAYVETEQAITSLRIVLDKLEHLDSYIDDINHSTESENSECDPRCISLASVLNSSPSRISAHIHESLRLIESIKSKLSSPVK